MNPEMINIYYLSAVKHNVFRRKSNEQYNYLNQIVLLENNKAKLKTVSNSSYFCSFYLFPMLMFISFILHLKLENEI